MKVSKTLITILILVLVIITVAGIWTNLTKDTGTAAQSTAQGNLYVRIVQPVHDARHLQITIAK